MNNKVTYFLNKTLKWNKNKITSIEKLGGLSSDNFKVVYNNESYFVKLCNYTYLHTDRQNEINIINKASLLNLCNKPIYFSIETGNMVSPWLLGSAPTEDDFKKTMVIKAIANSLKKLNQITCTKVFNPFEDIRTRIKIAKENSLQLPLYIDDLLIELSKIETILNNNKTLVLCHNDLNCSNIILFNNEVFLVDYEYSSMGDIFYDLANISWFLDDNMRKILLQEYFGQFKDEYLKKLNYFLFVVKLYNGTWSILKSINSNSNYDYLNGAKLIFQDLYDNYLVSFSS